MSQVAYAIVDTDCEYLDKDDCWIDSIVFARLFISKKSATMHLARIKDYVADDAMVVKLTLTIDASET